MGPIGRRKRRPFIHFFAGAGAAFADGFFSSFFVSGLWGGTPGGSGTERGAPFDVTVGADFATGASTGLAAAAEDTAAGVELGTAASGAAAAVAVDDAEVATAGTADATGAEAVAATALADVAVAGSGPDAELHADAITRAKIPSRFVFDVRIFAFVLLVPSLSSSFGPYTVFMVTLLHMYNVRLQGL